MIKLRAKYPRGHYKNESSYLRAVYRNNKQAIDNIFDKDILEQYKVTSFSAWKERLKDLKMDKHTKELYGEHPTVNQLLDRYSGSREMRTKVEQLADNALEGLKGDPSALKAVRKATGWNVKLDSSNITFNAKEKTYNYTVGNKTIKFDFSNSPKGVRVYGN